MVCEEKTYPKEKGYLKKLIDNMAEMQKWDVSSIQGDRSGRDVMVCCQRLYGLRHEYTITIHGEQNASLVRIETDDAGGKTAIFRQFLLLEKLIAFDEGRTT